MAKKKARAMWLARDRGLYQEYWLFTTRPKPTANGTTYVPTHSVGGNGVTKCSRLFPSQSPVKLKPGEGPVKVRLVVDK